MSNTGITDISAAAAQLGIEEEGKLPFDPATTLIGLWRRRKIFAVIVVMFSVMGVMSAILFGQKTYEAETVLIYRPVAVAEAEVSPTSHEDPKALYTQMNMVKILTNLEETKRRLNLGASPSSIGRATTAEVQRNTQLLTLRVRWGSPKEAADIANTLREVFLDNQRSISHIQAKSQIGSFEARLKTIQSELDKASDKLGEYTQEHNIIDVDVETQYYLQELSSVDILYEQTKSELLTNELQLNNVETIIEELKSKRGEGQIVDEAAIGRTNRRIEQIRSTIDADREARANSADLAQAELDFERSKKLWDKGLIPKAEFDRAKITFEKQMALLEDTDEMKVWKDELARLEQQSLAMQLVGSNPSGNMSDQMMVRAIDLRLQHTALEGKVKHLEEARKRVRAKLDRMPQLERGYVELSNMVTSMEAERENLKQALNKARRVYESQSTDFGLIAEAKPPTASRSSNRKLLAAGMGLIGVLLGFFLILGLELLDTSVKSAGELGVKIALPILGTLRSIPPTEPHFPGQEGSAQFEPFNIITRRIRQAVPKQGARILLVSTKPGEGKTWIAINMAISMGKRDDTVLLSDAQVRSDEEQQSVYLMMQDEDISEKIKETISIKEGLTPVKGWFGRTKSGNGGSKVQEVNAASMMQMDIQPISMSKGGNIKGKIGDSVFSVAARVAEWFDEKFDDLLGTETRIHNTTADRHDIRDLIMYDGKPLMGIGEYLTYEADSIDEVVWPTMLRGVEILPRFSSAIVPDLLSSSRMREFLDEVSERYSVVLLDGPAVFPFVDADLLAQLSDAIVFVVRSRYSSIPLIRKALDQIQEARVPVVGVILNDVDPIYQEKE